MTEEGNQLPFGDIHKQQECLWIIITTAWEILLSTKLLAWIDPNYMSLVWFYVFTWTELHDELFLTGANELQQLTGQMRKMDPTVQRNQESPHGPTACWTFFINALKQLGWKILYKRQIMLLIGSCFVSVLRGIKGDEDTTPQHFY